MARKKTSRQALASGKDNHSVATRKTSFNRRDIQEVAEIVKELGHEMSAFADQLRLVEFDDELAVDSGKYMFLGLQNASNWISKLKAAFRAAMLEKVQSNIEHKGQGNVK